MQKSHDVRFGCCHQATLHESLASELLQKSILWHPDCLSLHTLYLDTVSEYTVFFVANL